jgi:hypothetical protein
MTDPYTFGEVPREWTCIGDDEVLSTDNVPANEECAVGDLNSTEKGTGARKSGGKVAFSLLPLHLLAGCARVLMFGRVKYDEWNWAKGMPWSECFNCTLRHLLKWWYLGEDNDPETGEHHLDHVLCNILFLRHYVMTYQEGDDRPPKWANFNEDEFEEFCKLFFEAKSNGEQR